jgi:hypothetical protein
MTAFTRDLVERLTDRQRGRKVVEAAADVGETRGGGS